ncbi:MAG TPA: histidinol dehydrogenase [Dehalococcoidia bacterium]|nr:histidinol dehydrogenase [Dehalococcoidia bacterium]
MKIVSGYNDTKKLLSREVSAGDYTVTESLKKKLEKMFGTGDPEVAVGQIIAGVRKRGDAALFDYSLKIDGIKLESLEISREQIKKARRKIDSRLMSALKIAADSIYSFHVLQRDAVMAGAGCMGESTIARPLGKVGVYAPGGTASYPSTVLMTAIPAKVAGVRNVILMTPPGSDGEVAPAVLAAADFARVDRVFRIGGAQAIAALAFGTETVPYVDKICGPGNIFVMLAKKLVYGVVDIDGLQGPSEVVIIADEKARPKYLAAEILAQAEHDALASSIMITTSQRIAEEVMHMVVEQLPEIKRKDIAAESLANSGVIAVVESIDQAIELSNMYAPEHLCLDIKDTKAYINRITNAGCIFIGDEPTVVMGDYVAGPSHALPTGGTARFSSPLNITDFIKYINVVEINEDKLRELGPAAITIARAEGLEAHAQAVEKRLEKDCP